MITSAKFLTNVPTPLTLPTNSLNFFSASLTISSQIHQINQSDIASINYLLLFSYLLILFHFTKLIFTLFSIGSFCLLAIPVILIVIRCAICKSIKIRVVIIGALILLLASLLFYLIIHLIYKIFKLHAIVALKI